MVLCFAFFDQSIPFPQYYEISTKLDQTGTTAQVAHLESRHRRFQRLAEQGGVISDVMA